MKIWLKLCIGSAAGILLGLYLPEHAGDTARAFTYLSGLAVRIGRYILLPLVFFALTISVYELRLERKLLRVYLRTIIYAIVTSLGMISLGVVFVFLFPPGRIPIIIETQLPIEAPNVGELLYRIFPPNLFSIFVDSGDFLLPIIVFALFLGLSMIHDRPVFRSLMENFDSLSRLFYQMNSFITEFLFIGCIALGGAWVLQLRKVTEIGLFLRFSLVLGLFSLIIAFVIFPLSLYFLRGKKTPLRWIYAQLAPAAGAFFSGDVYFSLGLLIRHGKEVLGIPRKISAASFPLLAVFTRGGSAMVTAVSFIVILRSYSKLEIGFFQILWIIAVSFIISFLLGTAPGMGSLVGIAVLSGMYGEGITEGFLILRPISVVLVSLGAFLDTVCASFVTMLVSDSLKLTVEPKARELI
jgi:Na+/H+-dicarboxylate symporter